MKILTNTVREDIIIIIGMLQGLLKVLMDTMKKGTKMWLSDENQIKEAFINGGRGHPPSHLKFFLLVFSKLKEDIK